MSRKALAGTAVLLATAIGTPAHAAGNSITLSATFVAHPVGTGYLVVAECEAAAMPSDNFTPVATSVTCSIDDASSTQSMPGAYSVAVVANAAERPIRVCVSGTAIFVDTSVPVSQTVVAGPSCQQFG